LRLGGATIEANQGVIVLALAGLVHVPYDPVLLLGSLGLILLIAFMSTAFGVMVAISIKQARTFTSVVQMFVMPMIFLSGALYPVSDLPTWLGVLNRLNPLTYAVDPMRRLVFERVPGGVGDVEAVGDWLRVLLGVSHDRSNCQGP